MGRNDKFLPQSNNINLSRWLQSYMPEFLQSNPQIETYGMRRDPNSVPFVPPKDMPLTVTDQLLLANGDQPMELSMPDGNPEYDGRWGAIDASPKSTIGRRGYDMNGAETAQDILFRAAQFVVPAGRASQVAELLSPVPALNPINDIQAMRSWSSNK